MGLPRSTVTEAMGYPTAVRHSRRHAGVKTAAVMAICIFHEGLPRVAAFPSNPLIFRVDLALGVQVGFHKGW